MVSKTTCILIKTNVNKKYFILTTNIIQIFNGDLTPFP
jgi:hypothetical protein